MHKVPDTETKKLEKSLRLLDSILGSSGVAIFVTDMNGTIEKWNQASQNMYGYLPDEIIGKSFSILISNNDGDISQFLNRIKNSESIEYLETECTKKNGKPVDVLLFMSPIFDPNGKVIGISTISTDITVEKKIEMDLKECNEKFREILDNANDMIALNEMEENGMPGKFIEINKIGIERLGYSREEFLNMTPQDIVTPEKQSEISINAENLREKRNNQFRIIHLTKDGKTIPVEINNHLFIQNGKTVALAISRDITERIEAEKTMKEYQHDLEKQVKKRTEELAKSNNELENFAYIASHDLREPLRTITSFLQLLEKQYKDQLDDDANDFIEFAVNGAKRLDDMIYDLLEYSKITSHERIFEQVNCEKIFNEALMNLKVSIDETDAVITHDPLPTINGDEQLILQLFQNLLSNAIKYHGEEIPRIHLSVVKKQDHYLFSLNDNGIGMDPKHSKKIFTIFQRLHGRGEYEGTGIGLAISQKIVQQHGGEIWAESKPGEGSTFHFTMFDKLSN